MESSNRRATDNSKAGIESPNSMAIIQAMLPKKPVDTRRFLEKFTQCFLENQRKRLEIASLAELKAAEAIIFADKENSTHGSSAASTVVMGNLKSKEKFDLNKVAHSEDEEISDMQAEDEPTVADNMGTQNHQAESSAPTAQNQENNLEEDILEEALNPEPPTNEELEMDRMFGQNMYPSMEQISEAPAPQVGMEFDSKDEAFFFFAVYARRMGFAIKKDSSYVSKVSNTIQRQAFSCNRGRDEVYQDSALKVRRTCRVVQTKCKVKIYVKEVRGKWTITRTHLDHNHELAPSQWIVRFMRCHRLLSSSDKMLIQILQETRVPPRNIMKIFRKQRHSFRGVPFDAKYLGNQLYKEKQKLKNRDIEELLTLIKEAKKNMPGFYHTFDLDDDNTVKSVFWTDQLGKANYSQFGNFVSFDTTFSTNQYGMPFAPIVGVDCYGKTVIFGAALLQDETIESFKWMLKEFVAAMDNNHPETIITDQDVAMGIAISEALPFTIHRYCNFHIGKNLKQNCSSMFAIRGTFYEELRATIRNAFTPDEFESSWFELLQKYNAMDDPHLQRIFEIRAMWVPAYFMDKFFPFTSSTGRSESTNALFKNYVKRKDSITIFFKEYMIIQEKKQADIDQIRGKSEFKQSANWGYNPIEREAMKIYTDPIYAKFAEELKKTTAYNVTILEPGKTFQLDRVAPYPNAEFPRTTYKVDVSADGSVYKCTCFKMARDGIHCCHVLKIANIIGLTELPVSFIHPRWTAAAGQEVARLTVHKSPTGHDTTHLAVRHAIEMSKVSHILSSVCTDDASFDLFAKGIAELKKIIINDTKTRMQHKANVTQKRRKVDDPVAHNDHPTHDNTTAGDPDACPNFVPEPDTEIPFVEEDEEDDTIHYRDPPQSGKPGFNLGERPKSYYEKSCRKLKKNKAQRKCGRCRKPGHKRPNCPDNAKEFQ